MTSIKKKRTSGRSPTSKTRPVKSGSPTLGKQKQNGREPGVIFNEIVEVLQSGGDDVQYNDLMDELEALPPMDIITATLDEIVAQPTRAPIFLSCLIPDLQRLPALPASILSRAAQYPPRSPVALGFLMLYSSLFLAGYYMPKPWEQAIKDLGIDLDAYEAYSKQVREEYRTFFGKELAGSEDALALDIIDRIEAMPPLQKTTPANRSGKLFSFRLETGCPVQDFFAQIERVLQDPLQHESTFMAPSEATDLRDAVRSAPAKKLAQKIATLMERGSFSAAIGALEQLLNLDPTNALAHFIYAKAIRERMHETATTKLITQATILTQYREVVRAIELAGNFPNYYFFEDLTLTLQFMGYFHAAYILSLALLRIVPDNINLLLTAAFSSYQAFGSFKKYLLAAVMFDPARVTNFLDKFWIPDRFEAMDRPQDYHWTRAKIERLESEVDSAIDLFAQQHKGSNS